MAQWNNKSLRIFAACCHEGCSQMFLLHVKDRTTENFTYNVPLHVPAVMIAIKCPRHEGLTYHAWKTQLTGKLKPGCHPDCWCGAVEMPNSDITGLRMQKAAAITGCNVPLLTPAMAMELLSLQAPTTDDLAETMEKMIVAGGSIVVFRSFYGLTVDSYFTSQLWGVSGDITNFPIVVSGQPDSRLLVRYNSVQLFLPPT